MSWNDVAQHLIGRPLIIVALIVVGLMVRFVLHRLVNRLIRHAEQGVLPDRVTQLGDTGSTRRVQRARTMGSLLKSIVSGVTVGVIGTMILGEFVDVAPIVASAGILGVALGFGAQSLVKDYLSGIFMIFEDQYGVGDVVDLGEATGTVEAVSLRVTRIRDANGTVWYVRNGEILRVGNKSQNWASTQVDVLVAPKEDLMHVQRVLRDVAEDLWADEDYTGVLIEKPDVWGAEAMTPEGVTMRVALKTAPLEQGRVAREMRARIKARFEHEDIEVPQRPAWPPTSSAPPAPPAP